MAGKLYFDVLCVDIYMIKDLTWMQYGFRCIGTSRVGVPFIQIVAVISTRVVYREVGYGSDDGWGWYGCGEVVVGEEYVGECFVGCRFD